MTGLWQDFRYGIRLAAKRPGLTAVAVITLALGIGPNTAIFSVVNSLVLLPPPYPEPDRIVSTPEMTQGRDDLRLSLPSTDDFQDWRHETRTLASLALYGRDSLTLTGVGDPFRLTGARVSPALFALLGAKPIAGRTFNNAEEQPGAAPVVIISYTLWDQKLGRDPAVVGRPIVLDGLGRQVIGIMPATFAFPSQETQYWVPFLLAPPQRAGNERRVAIVPFLARLKPGVSVGQASAEGNTIMARNRGAAVDSSSGGGRSAGAAAPWSLPPFQLVTLQDRQAGAVRPALIVLWAAVGLVLLTACANVASLLLSRVTLRHREVAIRAALGASRARIIRQMLAEAAVLSLLGGMLGVLLAIWVVRLLPRLGAAAFSQLSMVHLDLRVLIFGALVSMCATLIFGAAPALAAARRGLTDSIRQSAAPGAGGFGFLGRNAPRTVLTVTQVALALILMVGASLLARSLFALVGQDLGYRPAGALAVQVQLPRARYSQPLSRTTFLDQILSGIRAAPGVEAAGATNLMPMSQAQINLGFRLPGLPGGANPNDPMLAGVRLVSPGLFKALGTRLLAGRDFASSDHAAGERVVIVNRVLADRYMAGLDPVGRQIDIGGLRRIVGVVESMRPRGFDSNPQPELYFPVTQFDELLMLEGPLAATTIVIRTSGDPLQIVGALRVQVARLDPQLPLFNITTLTQQMSDSIAHPRFDAIILTLFAGLALVLAAVGIYGVLASQVAQSTREIGIQMSLGATPGDIRRAVLRHGGALGLGGVLLGLAGAWGLSRFLASLLFAIKPGDAMSYAASAAVLLGAALLGSYIPARRATKVDPVVALRCE